MKKYWLLYDHQVREITIPDIYSLLIAFGCEVLDAPKTGGWIIACEDTVEHLFEILDGFIRGKGVLTIVPLEEIL